MLSWDHSHDRVVHRYDNDRSRWADASPLGALYRPPFSGYSQ
jgi:hypothetical protein